jgi:hypothetical protein
MTFNLAAMPYALELFFDSPTEHTVRSIWRVLAASSGSNYLEKNGVRPHAAVAVFDAASPELFSDWHQLAQYLPGLTLAPDGLGSFAQGVAFVRFAPDGPLENLHHEALRYLETRQLTVSNHYRAGRWVPHCTLAQGFTPERMTQVMESARASDLNAPWTITSLGLVRFPPTQILGETPAVPPLHSKSSP